MALVLLASSLGAPVRDLVTVPLPGFEATFPYPFKQYSGFLNVTGVDVGGYDGWVIHYQFHESQRSPASDPFVVWHTGGPGGSSLYGQWCETGYFQVSSSGEMVNEYAWNREANALFLEEPAGAFLTPADRHSGDSSCLKNGVRQDICRWNDVTQAQAYALTLAAFFDAFPEYNKADIFLAGESYAGQYIPNIAAHLLDIAPTSSVGSRLKGIAVGNGCWGGGASSVSCNGPNDDRDLMEMYFGKGLMSKALYEDLQATCQFPDTPFDATHGAPPSAACREKLEQADLAVGPHNVYNVYDNCEDSTRWFEASGRSPRWLRNYLHEHRNDAAALAALSDMGGGFDWTCGTFDALPKYFKRPEVRAALHLPVVSQTSTFSYDSSGPASITLYPRLMKSLRILIYNGDADACVPYVGNEEWTAGLAARGELSPLKSWHPWFITGERASPAGYATTYKPINASPNASFAFVTIRLAGHEVPHYRPSAAFTMISNFLNGNEW